MVVTIGSRRIFGEWAKMKVLFLAVSGPKFTEFWDDVVFNIISRLSLSSSMPQTFELKVATELRSR